MLGHGNPRLRVIQKDTIEANPKLLQVPYSIPCTRIKENGKMRIGKENLLMLKILDRRV
jgi:hypothetical protein